MTLQRVPLKYGLAAICEVEDHDRLAYTPPPVRRDDHADTCGCKDCVASRAKGT